MAYADRAEMVLRFGADEVEMLESLATPDPDPLVTDEALTDASEEVDSYLGMRYALPVVVSPPPAPLVRAVCDVARFRLYKDRPTEEVKYRYERTVKWLEQLAAGKVALAALEPDVVPELLPDPLNAVSATARCGVFGDRVLDLQPALGPGPRLPFETVPVTPRRWGKGW